MLSPHYKFFQVDDRFFSLHSMETFLNEQDDLFDKNPDKFHQQFDELYESDPSEVS